MKMTRQHFALIAEALRESKPVPDNEKCLSDTEMTEFIQWTIDCSILSRYLASTNPYFQRTKFLEACGVGEE